MRHSSPRRVVLAACALLACAAVARPAQASPMRVMESSPAPEAVMDGAATQFFVRFDGPVDHAASRLTVTQGGRVVQVLHPRLESEPSVLYASIGRLPPGLYMLRWATRSMRGHDASAGNIPFTVRSAAP